jgi:integrase
MTTAKLTNLTVRAAKPETKRREIPDRSTAGLFLVVQPSGVKSWALRYRAGGKARKLTIGRYPAIDLATARKLAKVEHGKIALGRDPGAEKVAARKATAKSPDALNKTTPFGIVRDEYLDRHIGKKRASTRQQAASLLRREFARWDRRPISEISRSDVHRVLDAIVDRGHDATANRSLACLKTLFAWAIERGIVDLAPTDHIRRPGSEEPRDRVLDDEELKLVWRASEKLPAPYPAIVRLLVLLGARRREIGGMRWSELNLDSGTWVLPPARAKNNRELRLPLPVPAIAILRSVPRLLDSDLVFTREGDRVVDNYQTIKRTIDGLLPADMAAWTYHDLRRSTASGMARLKVPVHVVEAVLNHRSGTISGVAAVYNRYDYQDEMKAALQQWADHIDQLTGGNVIALPTRA